MAVTVTGGDIEAPATTFDGWVPKTRLLSAPAVTLNGLDAGVLVSPVAAAVRVRPVAAVLMVMPLKVATPLAVLAVAPDAMVPAEGVSVTARPVSVETTLPNWSCTCTVTGVIAAPAPTVEGPWAKTSLFAPAGFTAIWPVVTAVTVPWVVSVTLIVYGEPAVELICRPAKLATPFTAATEVVPAAKLWELNATASVSVDPVFPVVIVLPNVSSIVTPTLTVPPAVIDAAGCVVIASLLSPTGLTVKAFELTAAVTPEIDVGVAVNV